jgi:hypothetical protein
MAEMNVGQRDCATGAAYRGRSFHAASVPQYGYPLNCN